MNSKYKTVAASKISISQLMQPMHSNFNGKIHGGYILNLLDQIAFACASKHSETYCVTASVDTVNFLKPIEVGELVTMKASVNYVGNTSMVIGIRVEAENIQSGKVKHCNSSYFSMVAKDKSGNSVQVPGLILRENKDARRFLKALERLQSKRNRQEEYDHKEFDFENYLPLLQNHKVKVEI